MLVIAEAELLRREEAVSEAFLARRGTPPNQDPPNIATARKIALLAAELQLVSQEVGGRAFADAWSEVTDALILARRSADIIRERLNGL